jgi:hypothetical protein
VSPSSGVWKTPSKSSVWNVVALELAEGPLFISWPVGIEPSDFREGMTLELWWTDAADRFGEYNLPVFGPPSPRS